MCFTRAADNEASKDHSIAGYTYCVSGMLVEMNLGMAITMPALKLVQVKVSIASKHCNPALWHLSQVARYKLILDGGCTVKQVKV